MDLPPTVSNTSITSRPTETFPAEDFGAAFTAWTKTLEDLELAVRRYAAEVQDVGVRAVPLRWRIVEARLERKTAPRHKKWPFGPPAAPAGEFKALLDALDSVEEEQEALAAVLEVVRIPSLLAEASQVMSRTFSEGLQTMIDSINRNAAAASAAETSIPSEALARDAVAGKPSFVMAGLESLDSDFRARPRGGAATGLYVAVLREIAHGATREKPLATRLLGSLKDVVLGGAPETKDRIVEDAKARAAKYHPIQAIGITLGAPVQMSKNPAGGLDPLGVAFAESCAGECIDMTLPRAQSSVVYDVAPLIDKGRAMEYGPLASTASGLNFKLVSRLKTIREVPLKIYPGARAAPKEDLQRKGSPATFIEGSLKRTIDGGRTFQSVSHESFGNLRGEPRAAWAPLAGPRQRVALYQERCAALIAPQALTPGAPEFLAKFEADQDSFASRLKTGSELVAKELGSQFEKSYDVAFGPSGAPDRYQALMEFVLPEAPAGFVIKALSSTSYNAADVAILRPVLSSTKPRIQYNAAKVEIGLTHFAHVVTAAKAVSRRIRDAYAREPPPGSAFDTESKSGLQRRQEIISHFQRAIVPIVIDAEFEILKPSLKLYAISQPAS